MKKIVLVLVAAMVLVFTGCEKKKLFLCPLKMCIRDRMMEELLADV